MRCPVDNETLVMADRNGVEIDYCPKCRGVWLDRGELDKIIHPAAAPNAAPLQPSAAPIYQPEPGRAPERAAVPQQAQAQRRKSHDDDDDDDDHRGGYRKKRRESFLGELFDF